MNTKKGFRLRTVCGENIIVAEGIENIDFSRIVRIRQGHQLKFLHIFSVFSSNAAKLVIFFAIFIKKLSFSSFSM